jgi:hypothetical protein
MQKQMIGSNLSRNVDIIINIKYKLGEYLYSMEQ